MDKKKSHRERGSALLVTIMITSVVLLFAMILLERIIPYSRQIRGLQDSVQSYYAAKSQVELAKKDFPIERTNVDGGNRIEPGTNEIISLAPPQITSANPGTYVIVSENTHLPLKINLFTEDAEPRRFGLSQKNPDFHILTSFGGILFDLTNRDTVTPPFSIEVTTDGEDTTLSKNIGIEFVHNDNNDVVPFFGNTGPINSLNGINMTDDTVGSDGTTTLSNIVGANNCVSATCSLKVSLTDTAAPMIIPVSFTLSTAIPDLNAVIVADGISPNTTYHSRIIELIPLIQGI